MKVVGLIVEYNPLHYGHQYHFEQSKKKINADAVVIVMSGQFLQRGEPALVDKWARTEMALHMGVDLVFELPYVYSTQQAQHFAYGAVSLLHSLPFVTHLCFGSESGDISSLLHLAQILEKEPAPFKRRIKEELNQGQSYPKAYNLALEEVMYSHDFEPSLVSQPNNILGLNYLMALSKCSSSIQPYTIKREKAGYHDKEFSDVKIASATSIRHALFSTNKPDWEEIRPYVPSYTLEILQRELAMGRGPVSWENYFSYIAQSFLAQSAEHLESIYEMEEGIQNRFKEKIKVAQNIEHLCELVKTKRYTWNRIQRMMTHTFTQFTKEEAQCLDLNKGPSYLRLLGYSEKGQQLLNQYKKETSLPVISSIRKGHPAMLEWDLKASSLHALGYSGERLIHQKREVNQPPLSLNRIKK